jgi:Ricin-type beta-trefoil lectin domain.
MRTITFLTLLLISTTVFGLAHRKVSRSPHSKHVLAETGISQYMDTEGWRSAITAHHSVLCLDIENGSRSEGARLIQWPCTGGSNQEFRVHSGGCGYFEIRNMNSGLCLAVSSHAQGAQIIQKQCDRSAEALWYFKNLLETNYYIINMATNFAMDVANSSYQWGAPIIAWPLTYSINQRFKFWGRLIN